MKKVLGIASVLLLGFHLSALGTDITYDNSSGDGLWATPANWLTDILPTAIDKAKITRAGTIATLNSAQTIDKLQVGHLTQTTLNIGSSGNLTVGTIDVGGFTAGQTGNINVNGGTLASGGNFRLGNGAGSVGAMTLTSGTITHTVGALAVGYKGTGTLNISGGILNALGGTGFQLGTIAGSSGTVNITGGSVLAQTIDINMLGDVTTDAQLNLLGGSLEILGASLGALDVGGDDKLHIEGGTFVWAGNRVANLDTLMLSDAFSWDNGQSMLGTYQQSWTNGTSVLYADYNNINSGKTTVWASPVPEPATIGLFSVFGLGLIGIRRLRLF